MRIEILILILGMSLVTYIPKALPAVFVEKMKLGPKGEKFLKLIPYTAMAALIFPGVFYVDEGNLAVGIVGAIVATLLAIKKLPVMVCVIGAIIADLLLYLFVL